MSKTIQNNREKTNDLKTVSIDDYDKMLKYFKQLLKNGNTEYYNQSIKLLELETGNKIIIYLLILCIFYLNLGFGFSFCILGVVIILLIIIKTYTLEQEVLSIQNKTIQED